MVRLHNFLVASILMLATRSSVMSAPAGESDAKRQCLGAFCPINKPVGIKASSMQASSSDLGSSSLKSPTQINAKPPASGPEQKGSHIFSVTADIHAEIAKHLSPTERADLRLVASPLRSVKVFLSAAEWFASHSGLEPFSMYRACIRHQKKVIPAFFKDIMECWKYVDDWYSKQTQPGDDKTTLRPTLNHVKIQIMFDLLADRFEDLEFESKVHLLGQLMLGAPSWTPVQRRSVLFYAIRSSTPRNGETHRYKFPFLAWDTFCAGHFGTSTLSRGSLVTLTECFRAAAVLGNNERSADVLDLLKIPKKFTPEYMAEYKAYRDDLRDPDSWNMFLGNENMFHDVVLAQWDANLSRMPNDVAPPLFAAVFQPFPRVLKLLVTEMSVDMNMEQMTCKPARDFHSCTSLMLAVRRERYAVIVKFLLRWGADPSLKNSEDKNALELAQRAGRTEYVEILQKWGVDARKE